MRYYSLNRYFKQKYGQKIGKLALNAGMSCPNRDGTLSDRGCIFCSEAGSGDFTFRKEDLLTQLEMQKPILQNKWKVDKFIAFFQSFTNTYSEAEKLDEVYSTVLEDPDIIGLTIATRADCLGEEVLELLSRYNEITDLTLEIGMQSIHDSTLEFINRGYDHNTLDKKLRELSDLNIKFLLHMIVGLPGESSEDILETVEYINQIQPYGIKIHSLYIQNDSPLYEYYKKNPFELMSKDEYTDTVVGIISHLDPNIVIERLTGDGDRQKLVAPDWTRDKLSVIGEIQSKLAKIDINQGDKKK